MIPAPLRFLDMRPLPDESDRYLVVDRLGLQQEALAVPLLFLAIAQHFDGVRDAAALARDLAAEGLAVTPDLVRNVAVQLGEALLLEDGAVAGRVRELETRALAGPRQARLAGGSYPADPAALRSWIDEQMAAAGPSLPASGNRLPALVIPHIDLRLGAASYAQAYRTLAAAPPSDVYVILGIGHAGLRHGVSLAPVAFRTPLGDAPADEELCRELVSRTGDWLLADQLVQAQEHSIECQVVFLQHLLKHSFTIVPILTGFGERDVSRIGPFLGTLRQVLRESGKSWTVLSSVDFSHVGPMYGDADGAAEVMSFVEDRDRRAIAMLEKADDAGFWEAIHDGRNPTRICGSSSMWSMLRLVEPSRGRLLDYAETTMDRRDSRVTFAALAFS